MRKILLFLSLFSWIGYGEEPVLVYLFGNRSHDNLALGIPSKSDQIIDREGYALGFCYRLKQPSWVIYRLTREEAESSFLERTNAFKSDSCIMFGSASPVDYLHTSYDRGHLAPAADMRWSQDAMSDSFYMSNMSPQTPALNRDLWKRAEAFARNCAIKEGSVYIVSGPIITNDSPRIIGTNCVVVPDLFYKVIYDETPPEKMMSFVMPNTEEKCGDIWLYATNVVCAEQMTGLNFFSAIETNKLIQLKSTFNKSDWTD